MAVEQARQLPSSYRDPSGFVFMHEGEIYRQVNRSFAADYEAFMQSGLYRDLVAEKLLLPHAVINDNLTGDANRYATIKPEPLDFVSYPYEWCFPMLKDAALLTLTLAKKALANGLLLKDASPYNVQLHRGRLVFIDTLSFERYVEGEPWVAYRQFCESFLSPLALMHYKRQAWPQLFAAHPDGIPLPLASRLLPFRSRLNLHLALHLHLHASVAAKSGKSARKPSLSKQKLQNLFDGLHAAVSSLEVKRSGSVWGEYYSEAGERPGYLSEKKAIVNDWLQQLEDVRRVVDLGGNRGEFSKLAATAERFVVCADGDPDAIAELYHEVKAEGLSNMLPLVLDLTAPSPAIGVNNEERPSFLQRASFDLVLALALVHHLALGKNIPFPLMAKTFAEAGRWLLVEFVEKTDEKAQLVLQGKKDVYDWYTLEAFEAGFETRFRFHRKQPLQSSPRILYLMERR